MIKALSEFLLGGRGPHPFILKRKGIIIRIGFGGMLY